MLNQAFLAMFTAISQLKNTKVGLWGPQEMRTLSFEKWALPVIKYAAN